MKWPQQTAIVVYVLSAAYLLYMAAIHLYVYFANKNLGQEESFLEPGKYLFAGLVMLAITIGGWYLIRHTEYQKTGNLILFFPLVVLVLFALYTVVILISSGGKWN